MWAQNLLRPPTFILHPVSPTFCPGFSQISLRSSLASSRLVKGNSCFQGWPSVNTRNWWVNAPVSQSLRWTGLGSVLSSSQSSPECERNQAPFCDITAYDNAHVYWLFLFLTSASWDHLPNKQPTPKSLPQVLLLRKPRLSDRLEERNKIKNTVASLKRWQVNWSNHPPLQWRPTETVIRAPSAFDLGAINVRVTSMFGVISPHQHLPPYGIPMSSSGQQTHWALRHLPKMTWPEKEQDQSLQLSPPQFH